MKRSRTLPAVAALALRLSASGRALAEDHRPPPTFPHIFSTAKGSPRVLAAIQRVARSCNFSEMERSGPSPAEEQRCERAETALVALGTATVAPVFASLDREDLGPSARAHLYDTVVKVGDRGAVDILVRAIEHLATPDGQERRWESEYAEVALRQLTFAKIGQEAPWESPDQREPQVAAREWRAWLGSHAELDAEKLLTERLDADRAHLHDTDWWHAFSYASFFAERMASREEGIAAMNELLARTDIDDEQKTAARDGLRHAKRALKKDKAKAAKTARTAKTPPKPRASPASIGTPNV
jgi:hypothetical protein